MLDSSIFYSKFEFTEDLLSEFLYKSVNRQTQFFRRKSTRISTPNVEQAHPHSVPLSFSSMQNYVKDTLERLARLRSLAPKDHMRGIRDPMC